MICLLRLLLEPNRQDSVCVLFQFIKDVNLSEIIRLSTGSDPPGKAQGKLLKGIAEADDISYCDRALMESRDDERTLPLCNYSIIVGFSIKLHLQL